MRNLYLLLTVLFVYNYESSYFDHYAVSNHVYKIPPYDYMIPRSIMNLEDLAKYKFNLELGPSVNTNYAEVIDFLMHSSPKLLKRATINKDSLDDVRNIFEDNGVEEGAFVNNVETATPWISFKHFRGEPLDRMKSRYVTIPGAVSFVVTNNVYELLKKSQVFDKLKKLRIN